MKKNCIIKNKSLFILKIGVLIFVAMVTTRSMYAQEIENAKQRKVSEVENTDTTQVDKQAEKKETLNEIVVVGYGTSRSKDLTSAIATIKATDIEKQITINPLQALQGKMAGVQIINNGNPGAKSNIRIRGVSSIGDSKDGFGNTLFVVDGIFVDDIAVISPSDIEDITVLKDASASAIYGVRAANGVVLITTKKGRSQKPTLSYDGYYGIQQAVNTLEQTNATQYLTLINELRKYTSADPTSYVPLKINDFPYDTKWYKEILQTAYITNHSVDVSGGAGANTSYSLGLNYLSQNGILNSNNKYDRFNVRAKFDFTLLKNLKFGFNTLVSTFLRYDPNTDAFFRAFQQPPVTPAYDYSNVEAYPVRYGNPSMYNFTGPFANPLAVADYYNNRTKGLQILPSLYAQYSLFEQKLILKTAYNINILEEQNISYSPDYYVSSTNVSDNSSITKKYTLTTKQIWDNTIEYKDQIDENHFSIMGGHSLRIEGQQWLEGKSNDVPGNDEQSMYVTTGSALGRYANDGGYLYNGLSFFGRGAYNFNEKYLATITFRADASSKFQEKWGYFPSLGLGWVISKEDFIKKWPVLNVLKLRTSMGMLGNDNVPANSLQIIGTTGIDASAIFNDALVNGQGAQTVFKNFLRWEKVTEVDLGLDFGFWDNKFSGTIDYFYRQTNDVIFKAQISSGGGVADLLGNYGKMLNEGVELTLQYRDNPTKSLSHSIGFNFTYLKNKVLALANDKPYLVDGIVNGGFATRTEVGRAIGSFYGYETNGIWKSEYEIATSTIADPYAIVGGFKYKDLNGDGKITEDDKTYLGSSIPPFSLGIDYNLNYKNWDFSISFQGQFGHQIFNSKRLQRSIFGEGNYDVDYYHKRSYYDEDGKIVVRDYPTAHALNQNATQQPSSFFVEDAWFIRIQNIQIGYTFKFKNGDKKLFNFRIYIASQRPYTFFTYNGYSPEIYGTNPMAMSLDLNTYPLAAIYSIGVKIY